MTTDQADEVLEIFKFKRHEFEIFMDGVAALFQKHPRISEGPFPIVHSIKKRIKDLDHLRRKIERKIVERGHITRENCFDCITDFAGVRVLHLKQDDFGSIKAVIDDKIISGDWAFSGTTNSLYLGP
jgi:putative GTP pyrophosphokinase